ncbi:MAG: DUF1957 domain-containing protein [Thermoleophilia bacterium]|nr:DUF1957 domain-containing protein [Thermoleophilia bacterium]
MSRPRGQLAIVLHTHMPYVEGFGTWPFGEEWLWFCVAESYLRLEPTLATAPLTVGVTPVLADQFERMRGDAGDRMLAFFADSREHVFGEDMQAFARVGEPKLKDALEPQLADYRRAAARFEELGKDVNALLASFARDGSAELVGGPATHAILPLMATDFGADLQLRTGLDSHDKRFGAARRGAGANGIWLPECAYAPGIERHLARAGVSHFCIDQSAVHGVESLDNLEPVALPDGLTAVPIDWRTIDLVWHEQGYPAAGAYRSSFKRTVHALMPWNNDGDAYDADAARGQARRHAEDFLAHVRARLDAYADERGDDGLCVCAVDTELLGHWWYEGPWWLQAVCDGAAEAGVELTTLSGAQRLHDPVKREPQTASWGLNKDLSTWDSPAVADFVWQTRAAELELFDLLGHAAGGTASTAAPRAARELLALQASDWAFIAKRRTAGDYAHDRYAAHLAAFERAAAAMSQFPGSDGAAAHGRPAGEGIAAEVAGLAPGLTNQTLADIRCAY